jgi:hypothetical protein
VFLCLGQTDPEIEAKGAGNFVRKEASHPLARGAVNDLATVAVSATWVEATSVLVCQVAGIANDDHDVEDALLEQITVHAYDISPGVGFSIRAHAPHTTWGRYQINVTGL